MLMLALFIVFCFIAVLFLLNALFCPVVYTHAKPKTKKKVIELACDGPLAKLLIAKRWGATTIPLPFIVLILYWVDSNFDGVEQAIRVHEFQHVFQDERNAFFLLSWLGYFRELIHLRLTTCHTWLDAYARNKFELEAYAVERKCMYGETPFPDWAK